MTQISKKKRKLPKNVTELPDHELMEWLFGKRVMKEMDAIVAERSVPEDVASQSDTMSIDQI